MRTVFLSSLLGVAVAVHGYSQSVDSLIQRKNYVSFGGINGFSKVDEKHVLTEDCILYVYYTTIDSITSIKKIPASRTKKIFRYIKKEKEEMLHAHIVREDIFWNEYINMHLDTESSWIIWTPQL